MQFGSCYGDKMASIIVFTQNLKLESLEKYKTVIASNDKNVFLTTHFLFENERAYISGLFKNCIFVDLADFLTDAEMAKCDTDAYTPETKYEDYLHKMKELKNEIVLHKVLKEFSPDRKYILSEDLGIDGSVWTHHGFKKLSGTYYYTDKTPLKVRVRNKLAQNATLKKIYRWLRGKKNQNGNFYRPEEVSVAYHEGRKYVFLGKMSRIGYRLDIPFESSEQECERLNAGQYETKETCTYMTTWHEHGKCDVPDDDKYAIRWAQDGYLPPNYTHYDYSYVPKNVVYYCWDILGTQLFRNRNLPYEMIPFRKKLYIPKPVFPKDVKNILVVASGSGDWTALKNRSDDDIMVDAFVQMARRFPDIHFTYRCHPTWVHPLNVGVNAINRVHDYFEWLKLPNLTLSSNIPLANVNGGFQLSFSRSSLEEDLKKADFVFGEHSISMIDAAFKQIPFCSINLTKRRNFFVGINDLGFPKCTSLDEIAKVIQSISGEEYQKNYLQAIDNYNRMTDEEH